MTEKLIAAMKEYDIALVKQLIAGGVDVNGVDVGGWTPMFWAAREGFLECQKLLGEAKADVDKSNDWGTTPLHTAAYWGRGLCVKVGVGVCCGREKKKKVSFLVQLLIDWKANVHANTRVGDVPLHFAAEKGEFVCMEVRNGSFTYTLRGFDNLFVQDAHPSRCTSGCAQQRWQHSPCLCHPL